VKEQDEVSFTCVIPYVDQTPSYCILSYKATIAKFPCKCRSCHDSTNLFDDWILPIPKSSSTFYQTLYLYEYHLQPASSSFFAILLYSWMHHIRKKAFFVSHPSRFLVAIIRVTQHHPSSNV
jgi:hypothetical protein